MPKKDGGKGKKGKGEDEKKEGPPEIDPSIRFEMEKGELMIEIKNLKEKVARLEKANFELQQEAERIKGSLEEKNGLEADIYSHFVEEVKAKDEVISLLHKERHEMEQDHERKIQQFHKEIEQLKLQAAKEQEALEARVRKLTDELSTLSQFKAEKAQIEQDNRSLKATIEAEREAHMLQLQEKESLAMKEKAKLKNEMLERLKETKDKLEKMTEEHLGVKTKKTMMQNEALTKEISMQSKQSLELLAANKKLMEEKAFLKRELDLSIMGKEELMRKMHAQHQTIKTLVAKFKKLEEMFNERRNHFDNSDMRASEKAQLTETIAMQDAKIMNLEREVDHLRLELQETTARLEDERRERRNFIQLQDETAIFVLTVINDVKNKLGPWKSADQPPPPPPLPAAAGGHDASGDYNNHHIYGGGGGWDPTKIVPARLDNLTVDERESVLRYLLAKVNAFQMRKLDERLNEMAKENPIISYQQTQQVHQQHQQQQQAMLGPTASRTSPPTSSVVTTLPQIHNPKQLHYNNNKSLLSSAHNSAASVRGDALLTKSTTILR